MKLSRSGAALAIAAAGLLASVTATVPSPAYTGEVKCFGINSCAGHGVGGNNSCKGQGITMTSEERCRSKGGKVVS